MSSVPNTDVQHLPEPGGRAESVRPARVRLLEPLRRLDALDRALVGLVVVLAIASALTLGLLGHRVHMIATGLDLVVDSVSSVITAGVAALAMVRFRQRGEVDGLFHAAAFLVSTMTNVYALALVLLPIEALDGRPLLGDGQAPIYITTMGRAMTALLLVLGGARRWRGPIARHPRSVLLGSTLVFMVLVPFLERVVPGLPPLTDPFELHPMGALPGSTPFGVFVQLAVGGLFAVAALEARRVHRETGSVGHRYIANALIFAAFAQVHLVYPGTYPGLVGTADLLRLAFDLALLLGIQAEAIALIRGLRVANQRLEVLQAAELDRAALEERTRLSRELHDGLAQDLWLAKLKASRLAALPDLDPEAAALCAELRTAIEAGLTEAQQAVMALRLGPQAADTPLTQLLRRFVDDWGDRFDVRVEFDAGAEIPRLAPRVEAELLRIAQEALTNVRRHADATVARVELRREGDRLALAIRDNGRGFDPDATDKTAYGLAGMQERAALIQGTFELDSRPSGGTTILVGVPVPAEAMGRA